MFRRKDTQQTSIYGSERTIIGKQIKGLLYEYIAAYAARAVALNSYDVWWDSFLGLPCLGLLALKFNGLSRGSLIANVGPIVFAAQRNLLRLWFNCLACAIWVTCRLIYC